jgi:hypothetical protein
MNNSIAKQSTDRVLFIMSIPVLLIWLGVLAFLVKWFRAWSEGRLEPGQGTSWVALFVLFFVALVVCASGIYLNVRAWQSKSRLTWQILSLIGAVLVLWAVSGD